MGFAKKAWSWVRNAARRTAASGRSFWQAIRPQPEARKGVAVAAAITAIAWAIYIGVTVDTGLGVWLDVLVALVVTALGVPLVAAVVALLLTILRRLPRFATGLVIGVAVLLALPWPMPLGPIFGLPGALIQAALGAGVATFFFGRIREAALARKIVWALVLAAALAADIGLLVLFRSDGSDAFLVQAPKGPAPPALQAANPALPGTYAVGQLFYGSGTDLRRPEYGPSVSIKTPMVDSSILLKDFQEGFKMSLRKWFWGFDLSKVPLNARVWYPQDVGPFPLVLIVHGNHQMEKFSDPGYAYLGELLASRGFILASVDENFLNGSFFDDLGKEQAARGWLLLEHLKLWRKWNQTPGNRFYKKVDMDNIALMGHSRGGEAAATAALFNRLSHYPDNARQAFDYGFSIKSVVAIAPADGQYKPAGTQRKLQDVNYLVLQGAQDADVSAFMGSRQFEDVSFTPGGPYFKAELYIYRANHGQFNTLWGRTDFSAPLSWLLNTKPILPPDQQRQIAKIYISAFLEATLHGRREYVPLFEDYRRIAGWLADTLYVNRYEDASYKLVSNFDEDVDVTTTTLAGGLLSGENLAVWREARIPFRGSGNRQHNGVFLGWNPPKDKTTSYTITLPEGQAEKWKLSPNTVLVLSLAATEEEPPPPGKNEPEPEKEKGEKKRGPLDFTVEMIARNGVTARLPLSHFGTLLPPLESQFTKLKLIDEKMYEEAAEPVSQSFDLPLSAFAQAQSGFDPAQLKSIRLVFDRSEPAVIVLDEIAFRDKP